MSFAGDYASGVCNIGGAEIRRRRRSGWAGLAVFAATAAILAAVNAAPAWYALLFLPAFAASAGFVQAAYRFCFYFGFAGIFGFGEESARRRVTTAAAQRRDRAKATRVLGVSALLAAVATAAAVGAASLTAP